MVVDLVKDLSGNTAKAAKHLEKPEAIVKMALAYAKPTQRRLPRA
jgi:hypothetical protein